MLYGVAQPQPLAMCRWFTVWPFLVAMLDYQRLHANFEWWTRYKLICPCIIIALGNWNWNPSIFAPRPVSPSIKVAIEWTLIVHPLTHPQIEIWCFFASDQTKTFFLQVTSDQDPVRRDMGVSQNGGSPNHQEILTTFTESRSTTKKSTFSSVIVVEFPPCGWVPQASQGDNQIIPPVRFVWK